MHVLRFSFLLLGYIFLSSKICLAAFELSGLVSYSESNLGEHASSRQNRFTGEFAWKFTKVSAIEFSYTQSRTKISTPVYLDSVIFATLVQTVTYDDKIYSASWVQNLVPSTFIIQPYFKLGGGRFWRKQKVEYSALFSTQEVIQTSDTGVAGAGIRIFLTSQMALKGEAVTYVPKYRYSRWKENRSFSAGLTWVF